MIIKTPVSGMTRQAWLEERRKTIGGSEIGAILGLNSFQSAYDLWLEKTGQREAFEGNQATEVGTELEDLVARIFCRRSGLAVKRTNYIYRNDRYPALHASPDRLVVGRDAGLECKTTSAFNLAKFHGEEFPAQYYAQAVQYMAVTEKEEWYIAVLVLGTEKFYIYHLTRIGGQKKPDFCEASLYISDAEIAALNEAAEAFRDCVINNTPPALDGSESTTEALNGQYPGGGGQMTLFGRDSLVQSWLDLTEQEKELKERKQEIRNILCGDLGNNELGLCGMHKVSWKSQTRSTFDSKACLRDHPEMSMYMRESTSRTFTIK